MARTLDPVAYAVRRDAFLDATQRLMQTRGFDQLSIQDVLDETDASRGAFYHYFDSKAALLDGVVERMVVDAIAAVGPVVDDADRSAVEKLNGLFSGIASWKAARADLLLALTRVWLSDDTAIVREKFRHGVAASLTPIHARIVEQGSAEGSFSVASADHGARVIVSLVLGANEHASDLFVECRAGRVPVEAVEDALAAYPEAIARILGAHPGSVRWFERGDLREWFG